MSVSDFGVKFGRQPDMGLEGQKAFPFIYTFVNRNDVTAAVDAATKTGNDGAINLAPIGIFVPRRGTGIDPASGSTVSKNILLDPDYNFKLLSIKFSVYSYTDEERETLGTYSWYENSPGALSDGGDPDNPYLGVSLTNFIRMTLSIQGSGSNTLYGGPSMNPAVKSVLSYDSPGDINGRAPVPLILTQGYDYGFYAVRRPYLLPREAIMSFDITNDHRTKDLIVAAAIYGMKVRV
jgi:hypothetical protein